MKKTLLAICLLAAFGNAHALLSVDDSAGDFGFIPEGTETNEFLVSISEPFAFGCFGCQLLTDVDAALTFDFFGSEAGFDNEFSFDGDLVFNTGGGTDPNGLFSYPAPLATATVEMWANTPTAIPFVFTSPLGSAANGSNPTNENPDIPNFFLTVAGCIGESPFQSDKLQETSCTKEAFFSSNEYWLFFDDAGADDDDNHDDMVVRVTAREIQKVPEAGTLGLLGMGLAMMGFVARRRG